MKRKILVGTLSVILLTFLLGGIESLLLQDIPLLCFCIAVCVGVFFASWLGNRIVPRNAPPKWGRWFIRLFTKLGCLCIIWSALFLSLYAFPPFFISAKTTYITEPRLSDRYGVDYLAAFEREVPNEDNAARHIVAASPYTETDAHRILQGQRLRHLDYMQSGDELKHDLGNLPGCIHGMGRAMIAFNRGLDEQIEGDYKKESDYAESINKRNIIKLIVWYGLRNGVGILNHTGFGYNFSFRIANCIDHQRANSQLTQLVFALELYRKEHEDRYPETLEALCSGYIEKMPIDPFSQAGESMVYKVNADRAGYLIYSVGRNGIDDGGEADIVCGIPKHDDIQRRWNWE